MYHIMVTWMIMEATTHVQSGQQRCVLCQKTVCSKELLARGTRGVCTFTATHTQLLHYIQGMGKYRMGISIDWRLTLLCRQSVEQT